jgi:hypothetical protein
MNAVRKNAIIVGVCYLAVNVVAGPLGLALSESTLNAPDYLVRISANETKMLFGALLVLVMAVGDAGIGIAAYPVLKKRSACAAIGYFGSRLVECVIFVISALTMLSLVTLSHEYVGAGAPDGSYYHTLGELLLAVRDWAGHVILDVAVFPLGAAAFYTVLYRSKLVPRWLSGWGLVGAVLYWASSLLVMFHLIAPLSTGHIVMQAPLGLQEIALGVWLIVKGFNASALAAEQA